MSSSTDFFKDLVPYFIAEELTVIYSTLSYLLKNKTQISYCPVTYQQVVDAISKTT